MSNSYDKQSHLEKTRCFTTKSWGKHALSPPIQKVGDIAYLPVHRMIDAHVQYDYALLCLLFKSCLLLSCIS